MDSPLRDMEKENCCNKCDDKGEPGYTECRVCPCHSLQKESEWEQSFDENFPDFGWCLRTDVGVNPSKDRVKSFISKLLAQREKEIAMTSLQKESEWWDRATEDLSGIYIKKKENEWEKEFDKKFWIYFVQYYPEKENGLFGSIKSFIYQTIANRENEIAEEVENIDINLLDDEYIDVKTFRKKVLQIIKH